MMIEIVSAGIKVWVNAAHVTDVWEDSDGVCLLSLSNGDRWNNIQKPTRDEFIAAMNAALSGKEGPRAADKPAAKDKESESDDLLTIWKAALETGIAKKELISMASDGVVPALKAGTRWLFSRQALRQRLAELAKGGGE